RARGGADSGALMANASQTIAADTPEEEQELGPAMTALRPMQKKILWAMLAAPHDNARSWARGAGYSDKSKAARGAPCRMLRNPAIERGIQEVCRQHLNAEGAALAVANLLRIARDVKHSKNYDATIALADRAGLHPRTEHKMSLEHVADERMLKLA